jgi:hypothetical protein
LVARHGRILCTALRNRPDLLPRGVSRGWKA